MSGTDGRWPSARRRRVALAGLVCAVAIAAVLGAGTGAAADGGTPIGDLADETQGQISVANTVEGVTETGEINYLRGIGALVGLALGVAVGSAATYYRRRY